MSERLAQAFDLARLPGAKVGDVAAVMRKPFIRPSEIQKPGDEDMALISKYTGQDLVLHADDESGKPYKWASSAISISPTKDSVSALLNIETPDASAVIDIALERQNATTGEWEYVGGGGGIPGDTVQQDSPTGLLPTMSTNITPGPEPVRWVVTCTKALKVRLADDL